MLSGAQSSEVPLHSLGWRHGGQGGADLPRTHELWDSLLILVGDGVEAGEREAIATNNHSGCAYYNSWVLHLHGF